MEMGNETTETTIYQPSKLDLHVEAIIHPYCTLCWNDLKKEIEEFILSVGKKSNVYHEGIVDLTTKDVSKDIQNSCLQITIQPSHRSTSSKHITLESVSSTHIHLYTLKDLPSEPEEIEEHNEEPITVCETLQLPHTSLHTSWENLILPMEMKNNLLSYAQSAILFSNKQVSPHVINWNRVLLLYGPPGTGKTSLCKALAHKLSIRSMSMFPSGGYLLEVKSHSLFSKWFSESGKLISRLFGRIREMVEDEPDALFFILMDEVESLASSRISKGGGFEPSDSVRAVNSLLTSLDSIRQFRNVMILSTSNITECVDGAFVDRVDWMVKVELPCLAARYEILKSCLEELIRVGILKHDNGEDFTTDGDESRRFVESVFLSFDDVTFNDHQLETDSPILKRNTISEMLLECARLSKGLSGRCLRKLPFQSHAFHVQSVDNLKLVDFMKALRAGIERKVKGEI